MDTVVWFWTYNTCCILQHNCSPFHKAKVLCGIFLDTHKILDCHALKEISVEITFTVFYCSSNAFYCRVEQICCRLKHSQFGCVWRWIPERDINNTYYCYSKALCMRILQDLDLADDVVFRCVWNLTLIKQNFFTNCLHSHWFSIVCWRNIDWSVNMYHGICSISILPISCFCVPFLICSHQMMILSVFLSENGITTNWIVNNEQSLKW